MHKLLRLLHMEWSANLQYRTDILLWTISETMTPLIALAIWYAVATYSTKAVVSQGDILTYYLLVFFTFVLTNVWNGFFFSREILNGEISNYLLRPISVFWHHFLQNVGEKVIKLIIPIPLFIFFALLAPHLLSPAIYEPRNIGFFIISIILALVLHFYIDMSLGALAFWLEDAFELRRYKDLLHDFSSGVMIPFALMPPALAAVLGWLPFRYIVAAPVELLMGKMTLAGAAQVFLIQLAWIGGAVVLVTILWRKGLKRYAVPGR